ncbi:MAG: hypothetical protein JSR80_04355 [Verrucomicrobia bacterium]|nr:hypothetical protein [Verrucomicrobiota bacterium]
MDTNQVSKIQKLQNWWNKPEARGIASKLAIIVAAVLGTTLVVGICLNLKGIKEIAGVKIDTALLAQMGGYGVLSVLMSQKFNEQKNLLEKKPEHHYEDTAQIDNAIIQKNKITISLLSGLAALTVGVIIGITLWDRITSHLEISTVDLANLLLPLGTLIALTASSKNEENLTKGRQLLSPSQQQIDLKDMHLTKGEKFKKFTNYLFAVVGIGTIVAVGVGAIAHYGFKVDHLNVLGQALPLDKTSLGVLVVSGGGLAAGSIKNILFTRSKSDIMKERNNINVCVELQGKNKQLVATEKTRAHLRRALGALLIAAGVVGLSLRVWSFWPDQMKKVLGFAMNDDLISVVVSSLTLLSFTSAGVDLVGDASVNYERVKNYAFLQQDHDNQLFLSTNYDSSLEN